MRSLVMRVRLSIYCAKHSNVFHNAVLEWSVTTVNDQRNRPHWTKFKISKNATTAWGEPHSQVKTRISLLVVGTAPNSKCFHFILCLFTQLKCAVIFFSLDFFYSVSFAWSSQSSSVLPLLHCHKSKKNWQTNGARSMCSLLYFIHFSFSADSARDSHYARLDRYVYVWSMLRHQCSYCWQLKCVRNETRARYIFWQTLDFMATP